MSVNASVLSRRMQVIEDRKANPPERSYTTTLFRGGVEKIGARSWRKPGKQSRRPASPATNGGTWWPRWVAAETGHDPR